MKLTSIIICLILLAASCKKENDISIRNNGFEIIYNVQSGWVHWDYTATFDSLCNIFITEKREIPFTLNSQRNYRISNDELAKLVDLTKMLSAENYVPEYQDPDTALIFDTPLSSINYKYMNKQDSVVFKERKYSPPQLGALVNYTLGLLEKYDIRE